MERGLFSMERGQIFSLDFILALVLLVMAIGIMYQQTELRTYAQKDLESVRELQRVTLAASHNMVSNPELVCHLEGDGDATDLLYNCLVRRSSSCQYMDAAHLGIPDAKYAFQVTGLYGAPCGASALPGPDAKVDIHSVTRKVVVFPEGGGVDEITRKNFDDCVLGLGACPYTGPAQDVTLTVWRREKVIP